MKSQPLTHLKTFVRPASFPLGLALDSFLLDAEARRLTPKTLRYYRQQLGPFLEALREQKIREPEGITAYHIRAYLV
ncbi:MAG TPA: site-specific integrase, partial [Caldilineae bacterium]|nr:site-specific integrase [Caldilineae bacterium]